MARLRLNVEMDGAARIQEESRIARQTLRFCYTIAHRVAQYVPFVRAVTTTRYEYVEGADPARLSRLLVTGKLEADDNDMAGDCRDEDGVLELIRARDWEQLLETAQSSVAVSQGIAKPLRRRLFFRPIDKLRGALPRGDL